MTDKRVVPVEPTQEMLDAVVGNNGVGPLTAAAVYQAMLAAAPAPSPVDLEVWDRFLEWRGIDTACKACGGAGSRAYDSTTTWRGGAGGQQITADICDVCWGSGDKEKPGLNLRRIASPVEPEAITTLRQAAIEAAEYLEWLAGTRPEVAVERQHLIAIDFAANLRNALEVSGG